MTGQKQRIINRFRREAKKKLIVGGLPNMFVNAMMFSLKEIEEIIHSTRKGEDKLEGEE